MASDNILVFFCDQLRLDYLGCYGGDTVRTPNIDALAAESLVFDHAYTPTALCSPARASLMTGLYPHAHHMFNNSTRHYSYCEHLRPDLDMLQDWAAKHTSYETAYHGKWHIGPTEDLMKSRFDHKEPFGHPSSRLGPVVRSMGDGEAGSLDVPMEKFPDVAAADRTRAFLNKRDSQRPFLAFCAFPGPHSPWLVPETFGVRYEPEQVSLRPNRDDNMRGKPINQRKLQSMERNPHHHAHKPGGDAALCEQVACCYSYMELIDGQVKRVLDELKRLDLYDSTTIVFTADHGDMAGSHGFTSKGAYMYDETYRIPMIVKPAGGVKARRTDAIVNLMDLTATLMHLMAGEQVNAMDSHELHGQSLMPLFDGSTTWDRRVHFAEYHGDWYGHYSSRMVTDGRWKLVWNLSDLSELYDLDTDPYELENRFYDSACHDTRKRYFALLVSEAERLRDGQLRLHLPAIEDEIMTGAGIDGHTRGCTDTHHTEPS